ncbi:MAG: class I fructose-bisphosphate aldolase, partial [Nitrososphaeria archaeon]
AERIGADAVIYTVIFGHPSEKEMFRTFQAIAVVADKHDMPVIGEASFWDQSGLDKFETLRQGVRALGEAGADLVKSQMPSEISRELYSEIIGYSITPVVAAGGPKMDSVRKLLEFVKTFMDSGGSGTAIGRNVWQQRDPASVVKAIDLLVHRGGSVDEALRLVEGNA